MWVGALEFDLLLGDVRSLKEKRSLVRPLIAEVRKRFELSVAEVDHLDLHRRAGVGVAAVSPDRPTWSRCWTPSSGWSPTAPRWSCCPYAAPSGRRRTDQRLPAFSDNPTAAQEE